MSIIILQKKIVGCKELNTEMSWGGGSVGGGGAWNSQAECSTLIGPDLSRYCALIGDTSSPMP